MNNLSTTHVLESLEQELIYESHDSNGDRALGKTLPETVHYCFELYKNKKLQDLL